MTTNLYIIDRHPFGGLIFLPTVFYFKCADSFYDTLGFIVVIYTILINQLLDDINYNITMNVWNWTESFNNSDMIDLALSFHKGALAEVKVLPNVEL